MPNKLEDLLSRVTDLDLRAALTDGIEELNGHRSFGLVFEKHLPESVRLPGSRITRGSCAVRRSETGNTNLLRVLTTRRGVATCRPEDKPGADTQEVPVDELVAVARFGDPVFPGLEHVGSAAGPVAGIAAGGKDVDSPMDHPAHLVIEGENFHALQALRYTHAGAVDLIYIDPPYNTGSNDWIYNDRYIGEQDAFRHSKWLSFVERRLALARDLLSDTGVIFVAIGDDEHHRLRMLMDQIFGAHNFLASLVWDGGTKSYANFISSGQDYMLVYARDLAELTTLGIQWRETKQGLSDVLDMASRLFDEHGGDETSATMEFKSWLAKSKLPPGIRRFSNIEAGTGRVYNADRDLGAPEPRPNRSRRPLIHPITGKPCSVPANGWRLSDSEMDSRVAAGRVAFGTDETKIPREKSYLDEASTQIATAVFQKDRNSASSHLQKILGDRRFPFPKDHEVLMRWIRLAAPKDAVVLDFFGGSGSTGEAVLRLNAEDGGTRQFILVTNNELAAKDDKRLRKHGLEPGHPDYEEKGVFQHVTWPRLRTVLTGVREDGSTYSSGLSGRIEAFRLTYQDPDQVADHRAFGAVAPLLWVMAGTAGCPLTEVPARGWAVAESHVVITNVARAEDALHEIPESVTTVFTVTDSDSEFAAVHHRVPEHLKHVRLYSHYLSQFMVNTGS